MAVIELIHFSGEQKDLLEMVKTLSDSGDLQKIAEEDGCGYFDFYLPALPKNGLSLAEKWASQAALDTHHATPMMAALLDLIKKYDLKLAVEKYDVE